jgi:hypothetical protein
MANACKILHENIVGVWKEDNYTKLCHNILYIIIWYVVYLIWVVGFLEGLAGLPEHYVLLTKLLFQEILTRQIANYITQQIIRYDKLQWKRK